MDDLNDWDGFMEAAQALGVASPSLSGYAIQSSPSEKPAEKEEWVLGVHAKVVGQLNELSYKAMLPTIFECTLVSGLPTSWHSPIRRTKKSDQFASGRQPKGLLSVEQADLSPAILRVSLLHNLRIRTAALSMLILSLCPQNG